MLRQLLADATQIINFYDPYNVDEYSDLTILADNISTQDFNEILELLFIALEDIDDTKQYNEAVRVYKGIEEAKELYKKLTYHKERSAEA